MEDTNAVFEFRLPGELDSVLELLEPLQQGAPAAAVTGAWAALEAMFIGPGDTANRVVAASRMARIVTCAYVLSELTTLAEAYRGTHYDELALELRREQDAQRRARMMEIALGDSGALHFDSPRHHAALIRMRHLVRDRAGFLRRVTGQLEDVFRRLYRQRNLIVHAGHLKSLALRGALRTAAPLVGAGVDTAVRAAAVDGLAPIELAAKVELRLELASTGRCGLADLLSTEYLMA